MVSKIYDDINVMFDFPFLPADSKGRDPDEYFFFASPEHGDCAIMPNHQSTTVKVTCESFADRDVSGWGSYDISRGSMLIEGSARNSKQILFECKQTPDEQGIYECSDYRDQAANACYRRYHNCKGGLKRGTVLCSSKKESIEKQYVEKPRKPPSDLGALL